MTKTQMKKVSKETNVSEVKSIKKISDEQLSELKDIQSKINTILLNLGNTELVKQDMILSHNALKNQWEDLVKLLESEYGQVNISLIDGVVTPVEQEK
jgi:ribosomal protein S13